MGRVWHLQLVSDKRQPCALVADVWVGPVHADLTSDCRRNRWGGCVRESSFKSLFECMGAAGWAHTGIKELPWVLRGAEENDNGASKEQQHSNDDDDDPTL